MGMNTKKRKLAELAALEETNVSLEDEFMSGELQAKLTKGSTSENTASSKASTGKSDTPWRCHLCGEGGRGGRTRCNCKKFIHHGCKTYGVCPNKQ